MPTKKILTDFHITGKLKISTVDSSNIGAYLGIDSGNVITLPTPIRLNLATNLNNVSDQNYNSAWFDYNWAGTGRVGSVISFSGLNGGYGVELFGQFGYAGNDFFLRSRNGDTGIWNPVKRIWTDADFTSTNVESWNNNLVIYQDNRGIKPVDVGLYKLKWGFATWNNDGTWTRYADYLHFHTYGGVDGGRQNLIMFSKVGYGLRQYQGDVQSSSYYTEYVDYWNTSHFTQIDVSNWKTNMPLYEDNRYIKPIDIGMYKFRWGFGTWNNNGGWGHYGDYLHFSTFDASGGKNNLIMFSKNGFGIRQYHGDAQDTNAYYDYVDYYNTSHFTQTNINNWNNAATFASSFNANNFIKNQSTSFQAGGSFWISVGLAEGIFKSPAMQFGTPDSGSARDMQITGNYSDYTLDFTRIQGTVAQSIRVGGVFVSNDYSGTAPVNGLYVKGAIVNQNINVDSIVYTDANKQLIGVTGTQGQVLSETSNGFAFVDLIGLQGLQGLTGVQGANGNQGLPGYQGAAGNNGTQGLIGSQGYQGVQGFTGANGNQGLPGYQGATGNNGTQGLIGSQGTQGVIGEHGLQGYQGWNGLQGYTGFQGYQGITGNIGLQGWQGSTGYQGVQGLIGSQGYQGINGVQGANGSTIDQWVDHYGYNYISPNSPTYGSGEGINTNGGYASRTQTINGNNYFKTDNSVEHIIRIDFSSDSCDLEIPKPSDYPDRVITITNNNSGTGAINIVGESVYFGSLSIDLLNPSPYVAVNSYPYPNCISWMTIKSIDPDNTGNYTWFVVMSNMHI